MSKPEIPPPAFSLCSDCAWPDSCSEDDRCTRARLTLLGFDTGMNVATAFEILGDASMMTVDGGYSTLPPSAIIEPPTKAELEGFRAPYEAVMAEVQITPQPIPILASMICRAAAQDTRQQLRAQIRNAIDEISKAQLQIVPGLEVGNEKAFNSPDGSDKDRLAVMIAENVLEALPEAVAHAFGLRIRAACAECGATIFKEDPYTSNAKGQPTCEAHADPEAA